jgi:hypothetical protein
MGRINQPAHELTNANYSFRFTNDIDNMIGGQITLSAKVLQQFVRVGPGGLDVNGHIPIDECTDVTFCFSDWFAEIALSDGYS